MGTIKIKMFGKRSVSTLLFWLGFLYLVFISIIVISFIPELLQNDYNHIVIRIMPLIALLALLIPLILIFNSFRKDIVFTKQTIKYLSLFAICNVLIIPCNVITAISLNEITGVYFFNEWVYLFDVFGLNILLAIFTFFITTIFKRGFLIQQENDLTI